MTGMATEYGMRLRRARQHAGLTQAQLQKLTGIAQSTISTAEREGYGSSETPVYAKALRVDAHWLATGEGDMLAGNTEPAHTRSLPLLDWVSAGNWALSGTQAEPEEMLPCPVRCGSRAYALRIKGLSMYAPNGEDSFAPGEIIFVDPDIEPLHGDFVVVRLDDSGEATFKRLLIEGKQRMLEAINPAWPERIMKVDGNASFCGVLIGTWKPPRRRS